ncbi:MAG: flavin reductase [Clostridiales bacterium]|nr:flavin reductase [Clostridiales bacterium]
MRAGKIKIADCSVAAIKIFIFPVHEKARKDFAERFRCNSVKGVGMAVKLEKHLSEIYNAMRTSGLFLTSGSSRVNTTTMSWGTFGRLWSRPTAIVPIRSRRYTYGLIEELGAFTISVPRKDLMKELAAAGALSGRDHDKFSELHLHPAKARRVDTYIVADCGLHLECRVVYKSSVVPESLNPEISKEIYGKGASPHTMFYGEILDLYET